MEVLIGLFAGSLVGLLGLLPGMNIGVILLASASFPALQAGGFIIGADAIGSIVGLVSLVSSSSNADQPHLIKGIEKLVNEGRAGTVILTAAQQYFSSKLIFTVAGLVLLLIGGGVHLKLDMMAQLCISIVVAAYIWWEILSKAKNKPMAIIVAIALALLGCLAVRLPGSNQMLGLTTCLFSIGGGLDLVKKSNSAVKQYEFKAVNCGDFMPAVLAGGVSSLLWGLPTSAILSSIREDKGQDELSEVSTSAGADGINSAISLILALVIGASRSANSTQLATFDYSGSQAAGLLILSIAMGLVGYWMMPSLTKFYINTLFKIRGTLSLIMVVVSVATALFTFSGWGIIVLGVAVLIQLLIKEYKLPREILLVSISVIPLTLFI